MERNVNIITDLDGKKIVLINDIRFKGKRAVDWDDVKEYLRTHVGDNIQYCWNWRYYIYIGSDLPDEYTGSIYTDSLKGARAKAKANASQGIPEMIEIATSGKYEDNKKRKHNRKAKNGWYRFDTRFALPVYDNDGEIIRYNVFHARLLIRHSASGRKYLYDITSLKKETSNSFQAWRPTQ